MLRATLTTVFEKASVELRANGFHVARYPVTRNDGDGPVLAAEAVLQRNGWAVVSDWDHESSGVSGNVWLADVKQGTQAAVR